MEKNNRSSINPFTGKEHFDIVDDDKFLNESYNESYNIINQNELLDDSNQGKAIANISFRLINTVEDYLFEIGRYDYIENYYDWEFHLVLNNTVNTFCMPGGKIVMFSGMLDIAQSEEEIAFILAHEMAHALLDHGRTRISTYKAKNALTTFSRLGSLGLSLIGLGELGLVTRAATDIADVGSEYLLIKPFTRSHEIEADELGINIINWAGYNIQNIPNFWMRLSEHNSNDHDFFSTHPSDSKRIATMIDLINNIDNKSEIANNNFCEVAKDELSSKKCEDTLKKELYCMSVVVQR